MDTLLQLMESYGYIALFVAMVLENANIPIPSEVVLGFAGFLISQQIFSFWTTFIVACLAGLVGSVLSYWLGSYGGRPLLLKYGKYIFFNEHKFQMAENMFNKYGGAASSSAAACPASAPLSPSRPVSPATPSGNSRSSRLSAPSPGPCFWYGPDRSSAVIGATSFSTITSSLSSSPSSASSQGSSIFGINAVGEMPHETMVI